MKRALFVVLSVACQQADSTTEPTTPAPASPTGASDAVPTLMPEPAAGTEAAAKLAGIAALVPPDFTGTGVLEKRADLPRGAPKWAAVAAEVVEENGQLWLRTSGIVEKVENKALAQSTATARARAIMAKWLGTERLLNTEVVDTWQKKKAGAVRARLAVPAGWKPGMPLPEPAAP